MGLGSGFRFWGLGAPDTYTVLQSPDIVVEYFEMMDRATMRFPEVVLTTPLGDSASNCAVSSARRLSSLCITCV
jgi:hypothetical protein